MLNTSSFTQTNEMDQPVEGLVVINLAHLTWANLWNCRRSVPSMATSTLGDHDHLQVIPCKAKINTRNWRYIPL